ncbi:MAG: nucleotide sugar dehydrogenase [Candidatus Omnitrophica bacterium]|nr:nucleotide sugar dehydrogenase [Candidatus Omnitrophota bacterium]
MPAKKIKKTVYDVCVIGGCGRAGLPLALCLAKEGKKVAIVDIDASAVSRIMSGEMPFKEEGAKEILKRVLAKKRLLADTDPELIAQSKVLIFILGTPVSSHLYPTSTQFFRAVREYQPYFRNGQLMIFRSTLYPGTTEKLFRFFKKQKLDVDVSFCPERISEGFAIREIYELPQIIAGFSKRGLKRTREFFSIFTKDILELAPEEAELAKLLTNAWRYIRFSIANQFFMIANSRGLDFYKIYHAITHNYPRIKDMPKAGFAAGPCLFKDTMQLAAFSDNNLFIGHAAMLINEGLPTYLINRLKTQYDLESLTVGILGAAFKAESDDTRESLTYKLRNVLEKECKEVLMTDPFVRSEDLLPLSEVIRKSDLIILGAPHEAYRKLKFGKKKIVIDVWDFFGRGGVI